MRTKRHAQRGHARRRARERYGVSLNHAGVRQLTALIRSGKSRCINRQGVKTTHQVYWQQRLVRVVYDTRRSVIVTFLPQSERDVSDGEAFRKAYREKHGHEPFDGTPVFDGVNRMFPSGRSRRRRAGYLKPPDYRDPSVDKNSEENELFREPAVDSEPPASDNDHGTAGAPAASAQQINKGEQMQAAPDTSLFKLAERTKVHLRMAITGPAGSGKTYTGLLYGRAVAGMDGRIAVVDSEHNRAAYYADNDEFRGNDGTTFSLVTVEPNYTVDKWIRAIAAAEALGFSVLILDSITQAWKGKGGLLEQKEDLDKRVGGNQYANWAAITKMHQEFIAAMLNSKIHLIVTMRSKQDYAIRTVDGKNKVEKLGMAPEQREGMEYEFAVVLDMSTDHSAKVSKDITRIYLDKTEGIFTPVAADALKLAEWLTGGVDGSPVSSIPDMDEEEAEAAPAASAPAAAPGSGTGAPAKVATPQPTGNGNLDRATPEQRSELGRLCGKLKVNVVAEVANRKEKGWKLPLTQAQTAELLTDLQTAEKAQAAAS